MMCSLTGGTGSAAPAWRTWRRTEPPGDFLSIRKIFLKYLFSVFPPLHIRLMLRSNRGRMTTSPRLQMQGTHTPWRSSARWVWRLFSLYSPVGTVLGTDWFVRNGPIVFQFFLLFTPTSWLHMHCPFKSVTSHFPICKNYKYDLEPSARREAESCSKCNPK